MMRSFSQNLVPNPSFEVKQNSNCPGTIGIVNDSPPWDIPSQGTPDLFNTCSTLALNNAVPSNFRGYQYPRTGNGYVGGAFYGHSGGVCYIEYIQIQLDTPLIANEKYCASFYVNLSNWSLVGIRNIGMYFSTTHTNSSTTCELNFIPQIKDTNYVIDTLNWTEVYGQFTAHGGERYIIIGNFNSDSLTDTIHTGGFLGEAYYFIDDVNVHCCICDSTSHLGVGELKKEEMEVYPNPATTSITLTLQQREGKVTIYNVLGEMLNTTKITNTATEVDIGTLPKGLFFIEVRTEKGIMRKKFIKQ